MVVTILSITTAAWGALPQKGPRQQKSTAKQSRTLHPIILLPIDCQSAPCFHQKLDQTVVIWHDECEPEATFCQDDQCYYFDAMNNNCCTQRRVCCTYHDRFGHTKYAYEMVGSSVACSP